MVDDIIFKAKEYGYEDGYYGTDPWSEDEFNQLVASNITRESEIRKAYDTGFKGGSLAKQQEIEYYKKHS